MRNQAMLFALVTLAFPSAARSQRFTQNIAKEQTLFGAEDATVERPVKVPEGALELLRKDDTVIQYLHAEKQSADHLTSEPFLASEIHLDGPKETDLIVMGIGRLRGNAATFWVFRDLQHGYALVLKVTSHDLRVETSRWKGLRNITAASPVAGFATEVSYRFDGARYQYHRKISQPIH
jgi:hypothetical protein